MPRTYARAGGLVAAIVLVVVAILVVDRTREERIADGVSVGALDVGGLTREEAVSRVRAELAPDVAQDVSVVHGSRRFRITKERAQARLDVEGSVDEALRRGREGGNALTRVLGMHDADVSVDPRVSVARVAARRFAREVAAAVDRKARDADIAWAGGRLQRTKERPGVAVRRKALADRVVARMLRPDLPRTIRVPVGTGPRPETTLADLRDRYPTVVAIDRSAKRLRLYKDLELDRTYRVAVGKEGNETTPGRYAIQSKQVDPVWNVPRSDWAGSLAGQTIPAGDPRNPLVARWMGFNGSQGIHGTDEISSLGSTASHGCIRMAEDDVTALYDEVETETPVFVQ